MAVTSCQLGQCTANFWPVFNELLTSVRTDLYLDANRKISRLYVLVREAYRKLLQ